MESAASYGWEANTSNPASRVYFHCVPQIMGGMCTPTSGLASRISSLAEPSSTRQLTAPSVQTRNCEQVRCACEPRTDSLGTSYTVKRRCGANGRLENSAAVK